jgi:phosphomannomutase
MIAAVLIFSNTYAADYKIGYVDIGKILNESPAAKAAQKKLEQEFNPRNKQLESKAKKIQKQKEKLQKESDIMSNDQIDSLKRKIMKSERDLKRDATEAQEDFKLRRRDELGKIENKLKEVILKIAESDDFVFAEVDDLGTYSKDQSYLQKHIQEVLNLELVAVETIKKANFKVVVDGVNSTGGIFIPALLKELNVECIELYCTPNGQFPHNPEPLKEHLTDISELVVKEHADFGIVVDPDVDRLAFVCEDGSMFGEEYTLVACADYVLGKLGGGNTVSNLSSSRALRDITQKHGGTYTASAVGEVNVVIKMKETNTVIGGEGNGGIIYPASHYGRDSLVGVALFLSHMAQKNISCKALRNSYPSYFMSKNKIQLTQQINVDAILEMMANKYSSEDVNTIDGVKIDFEEQWVHLRKSNTEPIIRIYTESNSQQSADELAERFITEITEIIS